MLLACFDVVLTGGFVLLGMKTEEQNQARKGMMIVELTQANQRLEEMIAENTGLQAQCSPRPGGGGGGRGQRMAREIHNTLAQGLTGIITQLEAAQQTAHDAERERRIDNASGSPGTAWPRPAARSRRCVRGAGKQQVPEALADQVAGWSVTSGVAGEVETTGEARALHPRSR